jgi:uncharacterized protein (TIGR02611 family)
VRGAARRVVLETLGWVLVVAGVAALILPGPGLLMLFGGLAILSQQYAWAERRMRPVEVRAKKAAAEGVETVPRIILSSLGALWLMGMGVLWLVRPDAPSWWPLRDSWWLIGGWPTGVTLLASGVIAAALIVYSIKNFRGAEDPSRAAEASTEG